MRGVLFATAASIAAIPVAPAQAQDGSGPAFAASSGDGSSFDRDVRRDRDDRHRHRGDRFTYFGDREYQGDTVWRADSFNDWWHERPNRSYPAWVARNTNCERLWWSGGGWRC